MRLIIAEKPSVAQSISAVLNAGIKKDGYIEGAHDLVSWCVGHLVELTPADQYDERYRKWRFEDLPINPDPWKFQIPKSKEKQFKILKNLMTDTRINEIICATDAGREGELIFRLVYHKAGCKKPVKRLWISSLEDKAIEEGFRNLKPGKEYELLYQSALCRAQADWLVGINSTRLFSVLYRQTLNVGRVMSPILAMVVDRWASIQSFNSEPFFNVILQLDGFEASSDRFTSKEDAEKLLEGCRKQAAIVKEISIQNKTENPPRLYDLTTLQREANRLLGYTAQQTLDYTQSLYEKKLVTYPRTDSRFLTSDMEQAINPVLKVSLSLLPDDIRTNFKTNTGQLINDSKVSDHHAIVPTSSIKAEMLESLPKGESDLLWLIINRLITAAGEPYKFTDTTVLIECNGHGFTAKGKNIYQTGWKAADEYYKKRIAEKNKDSKSERLLPKLQKGQKFDIFNARIDEGKTTPPKHYTEDTLLSAMESAGVENLPDDAERKGLGTPATRAGILEKLIKTELIERKGSKKHKTLQPTHKGIALATILPEQIKSAQMTAEWEEKLKSIEKGLLLPETFMAEISHHVKDLVTNYKAIADSPSELIINPESLGSCPRCKGKVLEGERQFFCQNKDCGFAIWKNNRFFTDKRKALTREMMSAFLKEGSIYLQGLYSPKTNKKYDAKIIMADDGGKYVNFRLEFSPETTEKTTSKSKLSKERM